MSDTVASIDTPTPDKVFLLVPAHYSRLMSESDQIKRIPSLWLLIWIGQIVVGLIVLAARFSLAHNDAQYIVDFAEQNYQVIEGSILNPRRVEIPRVDDLFFVTFTIRPPETDFKPVAFDQQVDFHIYNEHEVGDPVQIMYSLRDPRDAILVESITNNSFLGNAAFAALLALLLGTVWLILFKRRLNLNNLRENGQIIYGEVVRVWSMKMGPIYHRVSIEYGLKNPTGTTQTRIETALRPNTPESELPEAGTPVAVLYVSDHLYRIL